MRIAIVGASGAGLPLAAILLQKHPDWDVHLFDANNKIGKKLLATGNGHCNLLNLKASSEDYNAPEFVESCFARQPLDKLKKTLFSLGVPLMEIGDLVYPKSYTSSGYVETLTSYVQSKGVSIHLETKVTEYFKKENKWVLRSNLGDFDCDKVVFCSGGRSGKNLGSDGDLFQIFQKHGYKVTSCAPGLCPVKTRENVTSLAGLRHAAKATLLKGNEELYSEEGEVLFKKDGLSGIVIFNVQRKMVHLGGDSITLDLFPGQSSEELCEEISGLLETNSAFIPSFLPTPLYQCCLNTAKLKNLKNKGDVYAFSSILKHLSFHVNGFYGFEDSQVTVGGIDLDDISNKNFESKLESNVYFLGEVLDVDGPCGGYNLEWCLVSALCLAENL